MNDLNYETGKAKLIKWHLIVFVILLIISAIGYFYHRYNVDCDVNAALFACKAVENRLLFLLFSVPSVSLVIICLMVFIGAKKVEKNALSRNMSIIFKQNIGLMVFFIIAQCLILTVMIWPNMILLDSQEMTRTGFYAITTLFLLYVANMTGKMRKSLWSGWPTPWNMKSELAWQKSQRFAGFGLSITAILGFICAFIQTDYFLWVLIGGILLTYLGVFIISYKTYKDETTG